MAGGGRIKIKGGIASHGEAVVEDGALLITGVTGGGGTARFQLPFYGQNVLTGITTFGLMGTPTSGHPPDIPLARAVSTGRVAVKFQRPAGPPPGNWTLRLFKNGVEVATFAVPTT